MDTVVAVTAGLALLAVVSGMLGLGVAFAAIPFLGLFLPDLVHQVQPLSLLPNGVTALFSVLGFARSGNIVWKKALLLAAITTVALRRARGSPNSSIRPSSGAFISSRLPIFHTASSGRSRNALAAPRTSD